MLTARSTRGFVAVLFMAALLLTSIVPIVEAGADKYHKLKQSTVVYSLATGEWCYTDSREWPAEPDTQTDHYQEYHAGDETNTHTHNITIVTFMKSGLKAVMKGRPRGA